MVKNHKKKKSKNLSYSKCKNFFLGLAQWFNWLISLLSNNWIPYRCSLLSQLLHFPSGSLVVAWRRRCPKALECFTHLRNLDTTTGFGSTQLGWLWRLGQSISRWKFVSLSPSFCRSVLPIKINKLFKLKTCLSSQFNLRVSGFGSFQH